MGDPVPLRTMPRMRRAWLEEIGVETVWPGGRAPAPTVLPQQDDHAATAPAIAPSGPPAPRPAAPPPAQPDVPLEGPAEEPAVVPAVLSEPGAPRTEPVRPRLQLHTYVGKGANAHCWLVVVDDSDFCDPEAGPAIFLRNLMRAVGLQPADVTPLSGDDDAQAALKHRLAAVPTPPRVVVSLGRAARRALQLQDRIGSVARLDLGLGAVPAMALPAPCDITASAAGKAYVWRAVCALADAASG